MSPVSSTSGPAAAERVAQFLLEGARAAAGVRCLQGAWRPTLSCRSAGDALRSFAKTRVYRVPRTAAVALLAWADGLPVELWLEVPPGEHVLGLQARGARCVSLLHEEHAQSRSTTPFDFAVHDLCHVAKFFDPDHHEQQVGFFATLGQATREVGFRAFEESFDAEWVRDRLHVGSDMNGSAVFLFAVLKMKLKMAVRRRHARSAGTNPPRGGPLTADELRAFEKTFAELLDLLRLPSGVRDAACKTSARRDCPEAATVLQRYFHERGCQELGPVTRTR